MLNTTPPQVSSLTPELIKLDNEAKRRIKSDINKGLLDDAILQGYSKQGFEISLEDLKKIRAEIESSQPQLPNNSAMINNDKIFASAELVDGKFSFNGSKDPTGDPSNPKNIINEHTMFPEASVGKIRYAGLAYKMQQEGFFGKSGLQTNAKEFFLRPEISAFLEEKFPDKKMQETILKLFNEENDKATLADLLTHRAGIGDTTEHGKRLAKNIHGLGHDFTLADLLTDHQQSKIERDPLSQKPLAKQPPLGELGVPVYGNHEYSNLGYQLIGLAMEAEYSTKTGNKKNYEELLSEYMIKPIGCEETKFKTDESDNRINPSIISDKEGNLTAENPLNFNGALSAGGVQTSISDADKFYKEFFKGFPIGYDGENFIHKEPKEENKFFKQNTIEQMAKEAMKFSPANQWTIDNQKKLQAEYDSNPDLQKPRPEIPNPQYQFPGFVANMDNSGKIISYEKTGETFGGKSKLSHNPLTGENTISFDAKGADKASMTNINPSKTTKAQPPAKQLGEQTQRSNS